MADKKITELTGYTPPIDADVVPIVDVTTNTTKKITWANIKVALKIYFDNLYATLTGTENLTNKTLTTPIIASIYQDAGKTKLVTMPASTDTLIGKATTDTLTNKRITKRVVSIASSSTPTPDGDITDVYTITALAVAATFGAPTGTPTIGQTLIIRIKDNGTARSLGWNAIYRASSDLALPTTTVISKTMYLGFIYNAADSKWDLVAYLDNF